jgi:hypothetical protein
MSEQFVIRHQDGDITRPVKSGKIRFTRAEGTWRVGLELTSFTEENLEEDDDPIVLHLMDYPVGAADPRGEESLEIRVPEGFAADEGRYWTNLYFGEHFQPDDNRIRLTRLSDDEYLVEWTCTGEDVDYYDRRAKDNAITARGRARVVDHIQYPW